MLRFPLVIPLYFIFFVTPLLAQSHKYALVVAVKRYDRKLFNKPTSAKKSSISLEKTLHDFGFYLVISMTGIISQFMTVTR